MEKNYDLLKEAGFSDSYIEYIKNFDLSFSNFVLPAIDISSLNFKSFDSTELVIENNIQDSTSSVYINPL